MRREHLANLVEEISDRLRAALRVSDATEHALRTRAQAQAVVQLCEEATSLERIAAMLKVLRYTGGAPCAAHSDALSRLRAGAYWSLMM